jgi:hypothetical protein
MANVQTSALIVNNPAKVQGGFLAQMVEFAAERGFFTTKDLQARFVGRAAPTKGGKTARVTPARVARYATWCVQQGIFATVDA